MPQQTKIYIVFTISANHLGDLVRWEGSGLTMPKDNWATKIGEKNKMMGPLLLTVTKPP
jgi:hypothetical protein